MSDRRDFITLLGGAATWPLAALRPHTASQDRLHLPAHAG